MFDEFQNIPLLRPVNAGVVIVALGVAFLAGFIISLVYRWTYRGASYSPTFVRSLVFLAMVTAVVMLVIGNNLARAFGLVGAMSIIRFRTAVKDPQDIVFVFFALAVGLAAGVGMYTVALVATIAVSLVIFVLSKSDYAAVHRSSYLLQLTYHAPQENGSAAEYVPVLDRYCRMHRLINVKSVGEGDQLDLLYYVKLKDLKQSKTLTQELSRVRYVSNVNLFYDEEQM